MKVKERNGRWIIIHAGRVVWEDFDSEDEAWSWADSHVDDQVFDEPNQLSEPLVYEPRTIN